jgi:CIC family chloride channel protein
MAGLVGGTTGAALASIVMLLEMTLDYSLIVPLTATVAMSYAVRKLWLRDSIYTLGLVRRGRAVPEALQGNLHFLTPAQQMMETHFALIPAATTLEALQATAQTRALPANLVAVRDDRIVGWTTRERMLAAKARGQDPATPIGDLASQHYAVVDREISLLEVMAQMQDQEAEVALVTPQGNQSTGKQIQGVITKELVADYVGRATDWYHR